MQDGVRDVFTHYQSVQNTDFAYWLEHERTAGGRAILQSAQMYFERTAEIATGTRPFTFDNIYSSIGYDHYQIIVETLKRRGLASHEIIPRLSAFLQSDTYKNSPANQISSLLWAVIARNAALGQKAPPNAGMMNDISVVSALLPYCDAMFIDNGFRGLWENIPRDYRVFQDKRLFSYNMRNEFLAYLDNIEAEADPLILATVRDVYGEPEPFLTMYDVERRMRNHDT